MRHRDHRAPGHRSGERDDAGSGGPDRGTGGRRNIDAPMPGRPSCGRRLEPTKQRRRPAHRPHPAATLPGRSTLPGRRTLSERCTLIGSDAVRPLSVLPDGCPQSRIRSLRTDQSDRTRPAGTMAAGPGLRRRKHQGDGPGEHQRKQQPAAVVRRGRRRRTGCEDPALRGAHPEGLPDPPERARRSNRLRGGRRRQRRPTEQGPPGQGLPGHGLPGQGLPGHGLPEQGLPGQGPPGHGLPGQGSAGRWPPARQKDRTVHAGQAGPRGPGPCAPPQGLWTTPPCGQPLSPGRVNNAGPLGSGARPGVNAVSRRAEMIPARPCPPRCTGPPESPATRAFPYTSHATRSTGSTSHAPPLVERPPRKGSAWSPSGASAARSAEPAGPVPPRPRRLGTSGASGVAVTRPSRTQPRDPVPRLLRGAARRA